MGNVIVFAIIAVVVGLAIRSLVKKKKNGGGCGCGCDGNCNGCH